MAVLKEDFIQIPTWRCSGNKKLLDEISDILRKNNFKVEKVGLALTIIKERTIPVKKEEEDF